MRLASSHIDRQVTSEFVVEIHQEEPGTDQGAKQSSTGVKGPLLSHTVFAILHNSVHCLLLEAESVILEELRVQCHSFLYNNRHWCYVRCYLLEERESNVSQVV